MFETTGSNDRKMWMWLENIHCSVIVAFIEPDAFLGDFVPDKYMTTITTADDIF
jgi:hypothetical protein